VPNYVNDQRHAYANDERFGFSPMSSLVLFLANKIAVVNGYGHPDFGMLIFIPKGEIGVSNPPSTQTGALLLRSGIRKLSISVVAISITKNFVSRSVNC
jgi:hypothetical protein